MFRHSVSIRFDRLADAGRNRPLLVMIETANAAEHEDNHVYGNQSDP